MPLCSDFMNVTLFHVFDESAEKREVRGTEGGTVCHFQGIETTTHILFTFLSLSCVTVHLLAKCAT